VVKAATATDLRMYIGVPDRSTNEVKQLYVMGSKRAPFRPKPSGVMI